jgi:hypothetical protein
MTATTTIPESHPTHRNRSLWAALAFALAAVIGVAAAAVVIDDGGSSAGRTAVERETTVANPSAVSVSADAAEARAVPKASTSSAVSVSADAAEHATLAEQARDMRACAYYPASPEAIERCLNGG